jgi:hypothetical protein
MHHRHRDPRATAFFFFSYFFHPYSTVKDEKDEERRPDAMKVHLSKQLCLLVFFFFSECHRTRISAQTHPHAGGKMGKRGEKIIVEKPERQGTPITLLPRRCK